MQTFLPVPDFFATARILDYRRLGKQRVEAWQIIRTLKRGSRWANHPAVAQWKNYIPALAVYGAIMCIEWQRRGYKDHMYRRFMCYLRHAPTPISMPPWLGHPAYHRSHRSNLLRKDHNYYSQFGWRSSPSAPYIWPAKLRRFR